MDQDLFTPAYLRLAENGELEARLAQAYARLSNCDLCPLVCHQDRLNGKLGVCRSGPLPRVSSYGPHFGEEAPLSGWNGSGTIFFARCNLHCQYCQNWEISQADAGEEVEPPRLAEIMLDLQALGCHNLNLVSPSHIVPPVLAALLIAARAGLRLPLVYNTGGYDSLDTLALLDGVVDIYMPDMKYDSAAAGRFYSKVPHYPEVNRAAVLEMHRQVGELQIDSRGLARHGLLVRHLVLPNGLAGTEGVVRFLAGEISPDTYLNLMDQYRPAFNAARYPGQFPRLKRPITAAEFNSAIGLARAAGLHRFG